MAQQHLTGLLSDDGEFIPSDRAVLTEADWTELVEMAERHRLAPQLFLRMSERGRLACLPDRLSRRLHNAYFCSLSRGAQLSAELAEILSCLNAQEIPVIVLKGPHLAEAVYGDWALRPMADLDLLVRRTDLARAAQALNDLGYTASAEFNLEAQIRFHNDLPLLSRQGGFFVEPHWTLELPTSPFCIDVEGLWQRARKATISGVATLVLSNEDFLLHLCVHAVYHHRLSFGLLPIRDIAETLRVLKADIDWKKLHSIAGEWGVGRCLSLAVHLTRVFFAAEPPFGADDEDTFSVSDRDIAAMASERILQTADADLPLTHNIARLWGDRGFRQKTEIFLKKAFLSPHALAAIYPVEPSSKRIYLYHAVRLKDLLLRYGKTVLLLLRRNTHAVEQMKKEEQGNMLVDWLTQD